MYMITDEENNRYIVHPIDGNECYFYDIAQCRTAVKMKNVWVPILYVIPEIR